MSSVKICSYKLRKNSQENTCGSVTFLKPVSAIFYQIFISSPNDSPLKTVKSIFLFHLKSSFRSQDIQIYAIFSLPFHTFQIQKDKWRWDNL